MITSYKSCACHRGKSTSGYNLIFIYFASYELLNFDPILSLIFALVFHNFFSLFSLIRINVKSLFPLISLIYLFVLLMIRFFGVTYLMVDVVYTNIFCDFWSNVIWVKIFDIGYVIEKVGPTILDIDFINIIHLYTSIQIININNW